ncbi:Serine/threonine-protein kinase CTR1 [Gracilariopsis chorda]|uniref:Serine/threonine-protein kinase CTR1 n=1 Tax=Gracilariopsis chorda TaxID=448386 RepID=A0A2V3IXZ6_9FLOR|nr:Serine/threonine-protein kinase CTR1 [Gracilariopsis chorda]|eukprot:PXF47022.1 Serine/threonine-protein kinase CTR1 [Gracilariopsis chorda]
MERACHPRTSRPLTSLLRRRRCLRQYGEHRSPRFFRSLSHPFRLSLRLVSHPSSPRHNLRILSRPKPRRPSPQAAHTPHTKRHTHHPAARTPPASPYTSRPNLNDLASSPASALQRWKVAELTALKQKFNELDAEDRGFLTRQQFYQLFQSIVRHPQDQTDESPLYNFALSLFYSTGEDSLSLREFVTGMTILGKGSEEERLRYLFHMYDADNSGYLNAAEIEKVFIVMSTFAESHTFKASDSLEAQSLTSLRRCSPTELRQLAIRTLQEHDQDRDGVIGFEDFATWCATDPVVKTWLDKLCFDTALGIERLKVENERRLLAKEFESLGIFPSDFFQRHIDPSPRNSAPMLPPAVATETNQFPPLTPTAVNPLTERPPSVASGSTHPASDPQASQEIPSPGSNPKSYSSPMPRDRRRRTLTDRAIGSFEIDFNELKFERQIGSGSFATVWKCTWLDSPVAVKVFKSGPQLILNRDGTATVAPTSLEHAASQSGAGGHPRFVQDGESFEPEFDSMMGNFDDSAHASFAPDDGADMAWNRVRFLSEVSLLKSIRHPNCLLYMGACVDPRYPLCIVSSLINGGSLFELLHRRTAVSLDLRQKLQLMQDIALGMRYLHGRQPVVLHRDLKSQNILVEQQNDGTFKGTIIDFGLSKLNSAQQSLVPGSRGGLTGSLITMAPEVMNGQAYLQKADVYSYGIVCWEIFCRRIPFGRSVEPFQLIQKVAFKGERPPFESKDEVPPSVKSLVQACWHQQVDMRPDFSDITETLKHIKDELRR